jgi:phage shock protein PspC (stress-responsive transcriptional regulator)
MNTHIASTPQVKRLERPSDDRLLAGVASGLGRYFDLSPNLFRLGLIALTLLSGAGILVYLAAVLVIPEEGKEQSVIEKALAKRRDRPWSLALLGVFALIVAAILTSSGWILVPVAFLVILWTARGTKARTIAVVVTAMIGVLLAALATAAVIAFAWFNVSLDDGVGKRIYEPTTISQSQPRYDQGIGELEVDLSGIGPVKHETHVVAHVGIGELRIIVPRDAQVSVNAEAQAGEIFALTRHDDGGDAKVSFGKGNPLVIHATVGAGRIDVVRAG